MTDLKRCKWFHKWSEPYTVQIRSNEQIGALAMSGISNAAYGMFPSTERRRKCSKCGLEKQYLDGAIVISGPPPNEYFNGERIK